MKTILVTGGTGTIGSHLVNKLSEDGHHVIFTYNTNDEQALVLSFMTGSMPIQVDVTSPPNDKHMLNIVEKVQELGGIDVLINNAGINIPNNFENIDFEQWRTVIDVNLNGVYNITHLLMNHIHTGGRIVNIGSVSADIGGRVSSHYASSKSGLIGLTRNLALWFSKKNITCNLLSLGYIESDMADKSMSPEVIKTIQSIPIGRLGTVDDVCSAIEFLISDGASYITGQDIKINGGLAW